MYGWAIIEYAFHVWDTYAITNINKLEATQRAGATFCFNDFSRLSSVTAMLTSLDLPTLRSRRTRTKLIMMYKIINNLVSISKDYFISPDPPPRRGYHKQLFTGIKFSFIPSVIKLWNSLPPYIIDSHTLDQFCNNLSD